MLENEFVDLGSKTKIMSGKYGIRNTINKVPKKLLLQLIDPIVKESTQIGEGVEYYDYNDHILHEKEIINLNTSYDNNEVPKSFSFLSAVDEQGNTVTVNVIGLKFPIYLQCKKEIETSDLNKLAKSLVSNLIKVYKLSDTDITYTLEKREHLCFFTPDRKNPSKTKKWDYIKLYLPSISYINKVTSRIRSDWYTIENIRSRELFEVHESRIQPIQKLIDELKITPSGWFEVEKWRIPDRYYTHSQIEIQALPRDIKNKPDIYKVAPFWKLYWDIEVYSRNGKFPSPEKKEDFLISIHSYVKQHSTNKEFSITFYNGPCKSPKNSIVIECFNDLDIINEWCKLVTIDVQATIIGGYCVDTFDWRVLSVKSRMFTQYGWVQKIERLSVFFDEPTPIVIKELNSAAKGENTMSFIPMTGRLGLDIWRYIKDNEKLHSYTLKDVCINTFPDDETLRKEDLPVKKMWKAHDDGYETREKVVVYGDADARLPERLEGKKKIVEENIEMSRATFSSFAKMVISGQQYKSWSLIVYYSHQYYNKVINLDDMTEFINIDDEGYEGAIVLEPKKGFYDDPVITEDFSGLYPSIMMEGNLCISTFIKNLGYRKQLEYHCKNEITWQQQWKKDNDARYASKRVRTERPNVPIATKLFKNNDSTLCIRKIYPANEKLTPKTKETEKIGKKKTKSKQSKKSNTITNTPNNNNEKREHVFVQHVEGVCPGILRDMKKMRDAKKAAMKTVPKDSDEYGILDKSQLARKLVSNSLYGFWGAVLKGIMPCKEVAESVTCIGRQMIMETKTIIEEDVDIYKTKLKIGKKEYQQLIESGKSFKDECILTEEQQNNVKKVEVVYGDTDSVMVRIVDSSKDDDAKTLALKLGPCGAYYLTSFFGRDIVLEFEKIYFPYLLINRKRYAGMKFENGKDGIVDSRGLEGRRRDNWTGFRNCFNACLKDILFDRDINKAAKRIENLITDVANNKLDIELYVITKSLKKDYSKSKTPPAHAVVRDKIMNRNPGEEPKSGDRVPYVISLDVNEPKTSLRAEDPEYIKKNKLRLDLTYYVKSTEKPFTKIMKPCKIDIKKVFEKILNRLEREDNNIKDIKQWVVPMKIDLMNSKISSTSESDNLKLPSKIEKEEIKKKRMCLDDYYDNVTLSIPIKKQKTTQKQTKKRKNQKIKSISNTKIPKIC